LTTPEEAQAFLAAMRDKQHQREKLHQPPTHLSADGMDAWYLQQRQRERDLKERRREAENILRNYRGGGSGSYMSPTNGIPGHHQPSHGHGGGGGITPTLPEEDVTESTTTFQYDEDPVLIVEEKKDSDYHQTSADHHSASARHHAALANYNGGGGVRMASPDLAIETANYSSSNRAMMMGEHGEPVEETIWREFVSSKPGAKFTPQPGRYHLYCSYACPGSHRALIVRALKGLEHVISVTYLHPVWRLTNPDDADDKHRGWVFGDPKGDPFSNTIQKGGPFPPAYPGNEPDPHFNAFSIRDIYEYANDTSGKYTIPLLWDSQLNTIVNNESSDIAYMLNSCFNDFCQHPTLDLYTEDDAVGKAKLNEVSEWLSPLMIHGVYRCGFAKTQWAYDRAINDLCAAFDRADDILEQQRFLTGDALTDADIRLFVTLLRFDEVYAVYFKANARLVMLTPSLLNFCRDVFQIPGIAETCNMEQIKAHFFGSHAEWNKYSIVPRGLGFVELLDMPHHREQLVVAVNPGAALLGGATRAPSSNISNSNSRSSTSSSRGGGPWVGANGDYQQQQQHVSPQGVVDPINSQDDTYQQQQEQQQYPSSTLKGGA
jgi:glutathionyl-hydroquinone reductase